jgi:hypothetical protein
VLKSGLDGFLQGERSGRKQSTERQNTQTRKERKAMAVKVKQHKGAWWAYGNHHRKEY